MSIDICTWQADLANNAGPSIQVEMTTARTVAEARKEFDALVAAIVKNTAPGATAVPVRGDTRAMLEALAANATGRIGS